LLKLNSRFACNAFWLGRYMERAENVARVIDITETFARGAASAPDWKSVIELYADTEHYEEVHDDDMTADSIVYFYVLDPNNPTSVMFSLRAARENARSIRHLISTEMWTHLNMFWNAMSGRTRRDIWLTNLAGTCGEIKRDCQSFEGIAEGTFTRDETSLFYQIGKYIERADQTTRLLQMGYDRLHSDENEALAAVHRDVLLRSLAGYHAFRSRFPHGAGQNDVAKFLLFDENFPRAVALCLDRSKHRFARLNQIHGPEHGSKIDKANRELHFELATGLGERITPTRLHKFLDKLQIKLIALTDAIDQTYF
jgi:uncharacterized alpha-E superfamily protein